MQKPIVIETMQSRSGSSRGRRPFWFVIFSSFLFSLYVFFYLYRYSYGIVNNKAASLDANPIQIANSYMHHHHKIDDHARHLHNKRSAFEDGTTLEKKKSAGKVKILSVGRNRRDRDKESVGANRADNAGEEEEDVNVEKEPPFGDENAEEEKRIDDDAEEPNESSIQDAGSREDGEGDDNFGDVERVVANKRNARSRGNAVKRPAKKLHVGERKGSARIRQRTEEVDEIDDTERVDAIDATEVDDVETNETDDVRKGVAGHRKGSVRIAKEEETSEYLFGDDNQKQDSRGNVDRVKAKQNDESRGKRRGKRESPPGNESWKKGHNVVKRNTNSDRKSENPVKGGANRDPACEGKYIYIHDLPGRFNEDMLKNCRSLSKWFDFCPYVANSGLGPHLNSHRQEFSPAGWFDTNQFALEVIFHQRMKQYKCLTRDSSKASAIYVPYYAGLDVSRYLWYDRSLKDSGSQDLALWLRDQLEWERMWGRDHFFVAGRVTWDFRREGNNMRNWGNKLMLMPESKNMTVLTIESSPWNRNDFSIPYPTYFHPKSDLEISEWQKKVRKMKRKYMFCFAGAPRPNLKNSIRGEIMSQCQAARRKCKLLECTRGSKCYQPVDVMQMFESSVFCLQPPGDSFTRRSTFDAILAGCIPVFFHPGTAYVQYIWHFPKDYNKYSVWIPGKDVKEGRVSIERVLRDIPRNKVAAMREQLIRLIPKIVYADPGFKLETQEDAFDITVKGVLDRINRSRRDMEQGKNFSFGFNEENAWKFYAYGMQRKHPWDELFDRSHGNSYNLEQ